MEIKYDVIIIGTGAGGGTLAYTLAATGKKILLVERGDFLPREKENWQVKAVFLEGRYTTKEVWKDKDGQDIHPGAHYYVGGNTKVYGAALFRLREHDFEEIKHFGGISPAWPIKYKDMQPYYMKAEHLYQIHGQRGSDPTEPPENEPYPFPPVSHESPILEIFESMKKIGLKPFHLPLGIRLNEANKERSACIRCDTCDGFPCLVDAKSDAEITCIHPALTFPNVTLLTNAKAVRLETDESGKKVVGLEVERFGKKEYYTANTFVSSCGAINSAVLLLRSKSDKHPNGLANSSGLVGRNYMCHTNSAMVAISPLANTSKYEKTFGVNDFYSKSSDWEYPMGHFQLLGNVRRDMFKNDAPKMTPNFILEKMADHAIGWWLTSEDLPDPNNRVSVDSEGQISLHYEPNNLEGHRRLTKKVKKILRSLDKSILPKNIFLTKRIPIDGVAHQAGTCRFGTDPKMSVLDVDCKAHDLDNLYVVDGSFFPSIGAVNPALTIIANAIRVGEILKSRI